MQKKLAKLMKTTPTLSAAKLMIGPTERARSQYPGPSVSPGGLWG